MATQEEEKKSWIRRTAEASKKLDKYQLVAGLGMIAYGLIAVASGPVGWGIATVASVPVTNWAANRVIEWDKKRQLKKKETVYKYKSKYSTA